MVSSKRSTRAVLIVLAAMLVFTFLAATTVRADAASIKKKKPKFKMAYCYYNNNKVGLKWSKVNGAKKYVVYRSAKKKGKFKKFKTTKKTSIVKKTKGNYYYKVRAFRGKQKSKFSKLVHIFAVSGEIMKKDGSSFTVVIHNKTKYPMDFPNGMDNATLYKVKVKKINDPKASPSETWSYTSVDTDAGTAKRVPANSSATFDVFTMSFYGPTVDDLGETGLRDSTYAYMIALRFNTNGLQGAVAFTNNVKESGATGLLA